MANERASVWDLVFRITHWTERLVHRLSRVIGAIYFLAISALLTFASYVYATVLHALVRVHLHHRPLMYAAHTCLSIYLLMSVGINYVMCLWTRPSAPPPSHADGLGIYIGNGNHTSADREDDIEKGMAGNTNSTTSKRIVTASEQWRRCVQCNVVRPPRTHHCRACNKCYVRFCHHCPALGKCVARDNYPYFFRFIGAAAFGCVFAAVTVGIVLTKRSAVAVPHADAELLMMMMIGAAGVGCATGMLALWHVYLVLSCQTTVEFLENAAAKRSNKQNRVEWGLLGGPFTRSIRENVADAFGPVSFGPVWLAILLPLPRAISVSK